MKNAARSCRPVRSVALAMFTAAAVFGAGGRAHGGDCEPHWLPGQGIAGTNNPVEVAISWDPDGRGPQSALLVAGGGFTMMGKPPDQGPRDLERCGVECAGRRHG